MKTSLDKPIALILGGTVPHVELINQLKSRGYYTILIDYLPNPPAKAVADEHLQESTLDPETVRKIAKDRDASLVICGCVDQANITACYVMEQLGMTPPYSFELAKNVTNKGYMKRVMEENHIPTSRFVYVENLEDVVQINLHYPLMVKPADNNSSNGVKKANDKEQMVTCLKDALSISRNHKAIVEEFVTGREISAYCFITEGKAKLLMTAERLSVMDGEDKVIKCYASIAPARISATATKRAEDVATMIANSFGFDNTPLFFQGLVNGDDISVIEFAPRVGGGISFQTIKENTGFDIISATIDSYLGIKVDLSSYHAPRYEMAVNTVYGYDGVYDYMTGYDALLKDRIIENIYFHKNTGAVIDNKRASSSRIGAFITKAMNDADTINKVSEAFNRLDAFDINGVSMIRRDLSIPSIESSK